ncbi:MAG: molecular chaperone HtpG [Proteobacteria bacterium]|jgi:molecular chaperone HtpG|nr:molecular chaperone HtpG [Pseudomonadota bacterium]
MSNKQTLSFQTEVKQLLQLMIHSLYSNKEIFMRELVSNASDAIDKLRFAQIKQPELNHGEELCVQISFDKDNKTITISDNGIGMSYDEVIENVGTIAKSGTKAFLEKLSGDDKKDANLIGQFGVGFYSAFIVADSVELVTLKAGLEKTLAVKWISDGTGEYSIEDVTKDTAGTSITLHLKDGNDDLLSDWQLRSLIRKYSDHINYPIKMQKMPEQNEEGKEIPSLELETVNQANALWTRSKNAVTEEEYKEFYKHISHDFNAPLKWTHSRVEGAQEYTQLLYIPSKAPFDLYDHQRRYGIKLYIKRVFIMDDAEKLLPNYLRFVRGIIDSQDLPLNISREILQSSKDIDAIRSGSTKKVLSLIEDIAKNDFDAYASFWTEFGNVIKEGIIEDHANKERIAKLLRFNSTRNDSNVQNVSLDDYIARMKDGQDKIYYITAETYNAAKNSPHLEIFKQKDIEVLLLTDKVDEWMVGQLFNYETKELASVAKANLDLGNLEDKQEEEAKKQQEETSKPVIEKIKTALGDKVKEVKITNRLVNSPSCLSVDNNSMSIHLERMLRQAGQAVPESKPTLEINPNHHLIKKLENQPANEDSTDLAFVIFEQAVLAEGLQLDDPAGFVQRMNKLIS